MLHLNNEFYADLAQELITQICDNGCSDGVVEIKITPKCEALPAEIIFAFNNADYTLQNGLSSLNYLLLAFNGSVRCSTDFDVAKLEAQLD